MLVGMPKGEYTNRKYSIEPYNSEWRVQFEMERKLLLPIFGKSAITIEHVGSTSVAGLAGKPIIDILVIVKDMAVVEKVSERLKAMSYHSLGEYVMKGAYLFVKTVANTRLVNLHLCQVGHHHIQDMLDLRQYFRSHPKVVDEYSKLKFNLVRKYPCDYGSYRKYKDEWMGKLKRTISNSL